MPQPNNTPHEHTIRLRRPWEKRTKNSDGELSEPIRIDVPEPNSELVCQATVYQRRFNRPSSLDSRSHVRLDIASWQGQLTSLTINDQLVAVTTAPAQIRVTSMLQDHNSIAIILAPAGGAPPQLTGPVNLVIVTPPDSAPD
ncbi:MAG: hypothetical protein WBD20_02910 [Pirellulaceae bacterium]